MLLHRAGAIEVICPYNPDFVDALKRLLPWDARRWDGENKCWIVPERLTDRVRGILHGYFDEVEDAYTERLTPACAGDVDSGTLFLQPDAPRDVVRAAYRALAQIKHPDHGGDTEEMRRINLAYERLAKRWQ